jgi:hypothetical protein
MTASYGSIVAPVVPARSGTGSQDGANRVHGVLDARFAVDGKPSFQRDLAEPHDGFIRQG